MATLGTTFLGSWLALRGGSKPEKEQGPPINAKSKEEENFVKYAMDCHTGAYPSGGGGANMMCRNFVNKATGEEKKH